MSIKKVGVVGAGMMGAEIALCFARKGYDTILSDITLELANKGKKRQETILEKLVVKGKLEDEEKIAILNRVMTTGDMHDMTDCDFIIEAVAEKIEIKQSVFQQLDSICKKETILASNTSSISITKLSSVLPESRSQQFMGTHFNSPASVMKLVEVIPSLTTKEEYVQEIIDLLVDIGKEPIRVKDVVGFGLNRMFHAFCVEACRLVEEGVCTPDDVDKICLYGLGHPVGIFKLMDLLDLRLCDQVEQILFDAYGERFRPNAYLKRCIDAGHYGKKVGIGFHDYRSEK